MTGLSLACVETLAKGRILLLVVYLDMKLVFCNDALFFLLSYLIHCHLITSGAELH